MTYVISDLHGCYDKYLEMLKKINFSQEDTMYILGDVVDRGPDGIKILLHIAKHKNILLLRGNHDDMAEKLLTALVKEDVSFDEDKLAEAVSAWSQDGGDLTIKQFILSSQEDQDIALSVLGMTMIYEIVKLGENKFFLSHSVPEKAKMKSLETCSAEDFLWGEPDYDKQYFEDMIIVTGHTPTGLIDSRYKGKIYMKNNHIAIDCGAVFNFRLGCLRLDDMKEFYV